MKLSPELEARVKELFIKSQPEEKVITELTPDVLVDPEFKAYVEQLRGNSSKESIKEKIEVKERIEIKEKKPEDIIINKGDVKYKIETKEHSSVFNSIPEVDLTSSVERIKGDRKKQSDDRAVQRLIMIGGTNNA